MLNLGSFIRSHARYFPERVAVRLGDTALSYGQLDAMSDSVAAFLTASGVGREDRVALSCPNLPFFPIVYFGILKAGAAVAPLNVLLKASEIAYHLQDSNARAYFVFEGTPELPMGVEGKAAFDASPACRDLVVITADPTLPGPIEGANTLGRILAGPPGNAEIAITDAHDTAVILYTSGTTGQPKGAELSHLNMVLNAMHVSNLLDSPRVAKADRVMMTVLPLFHSFGQTACMNATFFAGGHITLLPRFDAARTLETMLAHQATIFAGVPTMYWALLNEAGGYSEDVLGAIRDRLTHAVSGGSALPLEILRTFEEVFGIGIMEGYGLSETSPIVSFNHADRERRPGTVGQPIQGVEMKVVDADGNEVPVGESGEIVIRGHNVMKGYYRRPEETAEAMRGGWFHSGDIGVMDDEGYFSIVDRLKDVILRGGFNVYPREVEEVLMTHPDVSLAAVVGVADAEHGEEIRAFVVLNEGSSAAPEDIVEWSREMMAAYKYPRTVEIRTSLPTTSTGKILRRELKVGKD